jgi:biotin carboxyl carrier protein
MQKFIVKVDGREYEVEVEEVKESSGKNQAAQPKAAAPKAQVPSEGRQVKAPLSGNILSIKVKVGDKVKRGDVLLTLEALKLENEITSPCNGTILSVNTQVGTTVGTGDLLVVIKEA